MKTNELKLFERGFWNALMGVQSDLPGLQANPSGVESNARNKFMQKMNVRALNAFTNAYKNQGIDIGKSFGAATQQPATQSQSTTTAPTTSATQPSAQNTAPSAGLQTNPKQNYPNMNISVKNPVQKGLSVSVPNLQTQQMPGQKTAQQATISQPQTTTAAPSQTPPATPAAPQVFTFGGKKYTKGPKGWADSKGKAADTNTANILDKAASQADSTSTTRQATTPQTSTPQTSTTTAKVAPKRKSTVPQGGGRVPGYLSQTPNAIRKRQARAAAKAATAPAAQPRQTVAQKAQGYLQQQALKKQAAPGKLAEYTINENVYNNDSKFVQWNRMLMEQTTGVSPGDYILPIINQMMAPAKLEDNPNYQVIQNAVVNWENAFKAQVAKTGQFDGKFDAKTQDAWNNVLAVVADAAFATLAANKPEKQAKP
jgi:hypothetical protein